MTPPARCARCAAALDGPLRDWRSWCVSCQTEADRLYATLDGDTDLVGVAVLRCALEGAPIRSEILFLELGRRHATATLIAQQSPTRTPVLADEALCWMVPNPLAASGFRAETDIGSVHQGFGDGCGGGNELLMTQSLTFLPALPASAGRLRVTSNCAGLPPIMGEAELVAVTVRRVRPVHGVPRGPLTEDCGGCGRSLLGEHCATCRSVSAAWVRAGSGSDRWPQRCLPVAVDAGRVADGNLSFVALWTTPTWFTLRYRHTGRWVGGSHHPLAGRWSGVDDRGNVYDGFTVASSGAQVWTGDVAFVPALDPAAVELTVRPEQLGVTDPATVTFALR